MAADPACASVVRQLLQIARGQTSVLNEPQAHARNNRLAAVSVTKCAAGNAYHSCSSDVIFQERELAAQFHYSELMGFLKDVCCKESLISTKPDEEDCHGTINAADVSQRVLKAKHIAANTTNNLLGASVTKELLDELLTVTADTANLCDVLLTAENEGGNLSVLLLSEKDASSASCSLWQLVMFNQDVISSNHQKLLFVIYQVVHVVHKCVQSGVIPSPLRLDDFSVDETGWLLFHPLSTSIPKPTGRPPPQSPVPILRATDCTPSVGSDVSWSERPLWEATNAWCDGTLCNFDYLLILNRFAGRIARQPHNHPIFPWVCDFSLAEGGWRDLTRTKYRLNKGDRQLDQSYRCPGHLPPHHLPDLLSDLGYYLYNARHISKSILCAHVRSQWVPEEYPSSMRRLYEWSPDECIPEFYSDASIFKSIHCDMSDLELPSWCETAQQFITWHRNMLDCDWVSQRLNSWIDLAFGYKLAGSAAVDAKNVHLNFVSKSETELTSFGIVQLFFAPHPQRHRQNPSLCTMDEAVDVVMSPMYELSQNESEQMSAIVGDFDLLGTVDKLLSNHRISLLSKPMHDVIRSLGILITEMIFPHYFSSLPKSADLELRHRKAQFVATTYSDSIPRSLRRPLKTLLVNSDHCSMQVVNVSPGMLLQPLFGVFNFPHYMPVLHEIIAQTFTIQRRRRRAALLNASSVSELNSMAEAEVRCLSDGVAPLLAQLTNAEAVELVGGFVRRALQSAPDTSVMAAWALFNPVAQHLGAERARALLLTPLLALYDVEQPCSRRFFKLYHRSFLLQLLVRFGTRTFVDHFLHAFVEAAAGERDRRTMDDQDFLRVLFAADDDQSNCDSDADQLC